MKFTFHQDQIITMLKDRIVSESKLEGKFHLHTVISNLPQDNGIVFTLEFKEKDK